MQTLSQTSQVSSDPLAAIAERLNLTENDKSLVTRLVLLNPDLLKAQYPNSQALASQAKELSENGNGAVSTNRYASAARLALYEGDVASAQKYLELAASMDKDSWYAVGPESFSKVSNCVLEYYKSKMAPV